MDRRKFLVILSWISYQGHKIRHWFILMIFSFTFIINCHCNFTHVNIIMNSYFVWAWAENNYSFDYQHRELLIYFMIKNTEELMVRFYRRWICKWTWLSFDPFKWLDSLVLMHINNYHTIYSSLFFHSLLLFHEFFS